MSGDTWMQLFATFLGGSFLLGIAAVWKSRKEADRAAAEATQTIVGAADDVVSMLTAQMARMETRLDSLEDSHVAYERWSQKVVDLLDRLLASEAAAHWHEDVNELKQTKPKYRGGHR